VQAAIAPGTAVVAATGHGRGFTPNSPGLTTPILIRQVLYLA
jgi:hypothetical protein